MILPTTIIGSIEFFLACAAASWLLIFIGRLIYAPIYLLREARKELADYREILRPKLKCFFHMTDVACVRQNTTLNIKSLPGQLSSTSSSSYTAIGFDARPSPERQHFSIYWRGYWETN